MQIEIIATITMTLTVKMKTVTVLILLSQRTSKIFIWVISKFSTLDNLGTGLIFGIKILKTLNIRILISSLFIELDDIQFIGILLITLDLGEDTKIHRWSILYRSMTVFPDSQQFTVLTRRPFWILSVLIPSVTAFSLRMVTNHIII